MDNRLEGIRDISLKHGVPFYDVSQIYTKASNRVYIRNFRRGQLTYGHPSLEKEVFDVTQRYFSIKKKVEKENRTS